MVGWLGNILSRVGGSVAVSGAVSDEAATKALYKETKNLFDASRYQSTNSFDYAVECALDLAETHSLLQNPALIRALADCVQSLAIDEAIMPLDVVWEEVDFTGTEGYHLRHYFEQHKRYHANWNITNRRFRAALETFFEPLLCELPPLPQGRHDARWGFGIMLGDTIPDLRPAIDYLLRVGFQADLYDARLFEELRRLLHANICAVSGLDPDADHPERVYQMPRDFTGSRDSLIEAYLDQTPFKGLLTTPIPFTLPKPARFEHTHIVGGTGHGKTQLLSHLIVQDLADIALGENKSLVVIDSQGDLIRKLTSMAIFDPHADNGLADKLVIIDPHDIDYPTALNIFHLNEERLGQYGQVERERVFNAAVELYEHFFESLLEAELTQKQGVAFTYLARMMLELPNANILTLRDLMDYPARFTPQIKQLPEAVRLFFEREFLTKAYQPTRRQISRRLWGVLAIPALERIFSQSEHKIDFFDLLNSGKIILINTSQALLKKEGSAIFGKFFLAVIAQAIGERAMLDEGARTETIIYLDEAHEYADQSLEALLNQGRKYRAGVVVAHQFLDQLSARTRQTLLANAAIKIAGGLSYKDSQTLAREMATTPEFLASLQKRQSATEFGLWIKNTLPQAVRMRVPFGVLEQHHALDEEGRERLLVQNRERYGVSETQAPYQEEEVKEQEGEVVETAEAPPEPTAGRGGSQHQILQLMARNLAHDLGLGAEIEASCQNSQGAIDVLLTGEQVTLAIEISITTSAEHELGNLKKCLQEAVDYVLCLSPDDKHRAQIHNLALERLPQSQIKRLKFLNPRALPEYLAQFDARETTLSRGYEVLVKTAPIDPEELAYRAMRIKRLLREMQESQTP